MPKGKTDIWNHFTLQTDTQRKDNCAFCNFCNQSFKINATRMRKHLVRDCNKCPKVIKAKYADQVAFSSFKLKSDLPDRRPRASASSSEIPADERVSDIEDNVEDSLPNPNPLSMTPAVVSGNHKENTLNTELVVSGRQSVAVTSSTVTADVEMRNFSHKQQVTLYQFADRMTDNEQNELDSSFAKAVYATASPLSMAENKHWLEFFKKLRPAWRSPSTYAMSNRLLGDWVEKVELANHKKTLEAATLAIMSDGWSCVSGDSHIQFLVSTPEPIFVKSVHPKAKSHTAQFIYEEVCKIIEGVDGEESVLGRPPTDVSAFCTDNASNMKSAWQLLKAKYPWLFCYGCSAHSLNLLAGDFRRISNIKTTIDDNRSISRFFREHQIPKAVPEEKTNTVLGKPLTCILGVATRWSSDYYMVKRNVRLKQALMHCALDSRCSKAFSTKKTEKALILDEEGFWNRSRLVSQLLEHVRDAIAEVEGDVVPISIIPRLWNVLRCRVRKVAEQLVNTSVISMEEMDELMSLVDSREEFCLHSVHMAAHIIDPRFMGSDLSDERVSIAESVILDVASRCGVSDTECLDDLSDFRARRGFIYGSDSRPHIWKHASSIDLKPLSWWSSYAPNRPLGRIAKILLALPTSIAAVERTNKAYSQQKTKHRNRLSDKRSADLTMVAYNLQSAARKKTVENKTKKLHIALVLPDCHEESDSVKENETSNEQEMNDSDSDTEADEQESVSQSDLEHDEDATASYGSERENPESDCSDDDNSEPNSENRLASYSAGDYVVVAFNGKKNPVHYIGLLIEQEQSQSHMSVDGDDHDEELRATPSPIGTDWKVKFFRRESLSSFMFVFPNVEEISIVNENSFCQKLPCPAVGGGTARKRSHVVFPTDLSHYKLR